METRTASFTKTRTTGIRAAAAGMLKRTALALAFVTFALILAACDDEPPFQEVILAAPRTVQFEIDSNELIPNQDNRLWMDGYQSYAPLLDHRRRIVANSSVKRAILSGPAVPGLRLAWDDCQENEVDFTAMGLSCTPVPFENQDRLEFSWRAVGALPTSYALDDALNRPAFSPGTLTIPFATYTESREALSLAYPGAQLRFVSGPAVPYQPPPAWAGMPSPPRGEGTGFAINAIQLLPSTDPTPGRDSGRSQVILPYEQVTGVLLGDGEDSFRFRLPPSENAQSVAIWFQPGVSTSSVTAYARCSIMPRHDLFDLSQSSATGAEDTPIFLDFPSGECTDGWAVVIASEPSAPVADIVFHFTVAEHFDSREWSEIRVGIEMPTSDSFEDYNIRQSLRWAAWKFYAMTGGTQIVRSFRYFQQEGGCHDVNICWRNRPNVVGCRPGGVKFWELFETYIHICSDPRTLPLTPMGLNAQASIIAHEFGHYFAGLKDEYWRSNFTARICGHPDELGEPGFLIRRCSHSAMSSIWNVNVNSLCVGHAHDGAPDFNIQSGPTTLNGASPNVAGSPFTVAGPSTITECRVGRPNVAGPHGSPAWSQMTDIVPRPHPDWSPVNFDYRWFTWSRWRNEIGHNLN